MKRQKWLFWIICLGLISSCSSVPDQIKEVTQSILDSPEEPLETAETDGTVPQVFQTAQVKQHKPFTPKKESPPIAQTENEPVNPSSQIGLVQPVLSAEQQEQIKLAKTYGSQVLQYYQQGLFQKALPLAEKAYRLTKEVLGEKHPDTLISLNNLI